MEEQEYIDYFENLARRNVRIQHSETNNAFYVIREDNLKELDNAIRSLSLPALLLDEYLDDVLTEDNTRVRIHGGFSIVCKVEKGDLASIRQARMLARSIARSILKRIRKDALPGGVLSGKRLINATHHEGEKAPTVADICTGWGYPFEWTFPLPMAVETDDWSDL